MPALQSFVDKVGPTVSASWLNIVDVLCTTVFGQAATAPAARSALYTDLPLEVANGGTAARTLSAARASLTSDAPWSIAQGGTGQTAAGQALLTALGLTQSVVGNILYPKTVSETNAAVTIVNGNYAPGVIDRYGTNTTPGTTAMDAAITAALSCVGQPVIFGPFVYAVSAGAIAVPAGQQIIGAGKFVSTIKALASVPNATGIFTISSNSSLISDLGFDMSLLSANTLIQAIAIQNGATDACIQRCYFTYGRINITGTNTRTCILDNIMYNTGANGTSAGAISAGDSTNGTKDFLIRGNRCYSSNGAGIAILGAVDGIVSDNICDGNTGSGIYVPAGQYLTVSGNVCRSNLQSGIGWNSASPTPQRSSITCNVCENNTYDGFDINLVNTETFAYLSVANNIAVNNGTSVGATGFNITGVSQSSITGNVSFNNGTYGFNIQSAFLNTISGNVASGNSVKLAATYSGIFLTGSHFNSVTGNVCDGTGAGNAQLWGIQEAGSSDNNTFVGNSTSNNTNPGIAIVGTASISKGNYPYAAVDSVVQSIVASASTITTAFEKELVNSNGVYTGLILSVGKYHGQMCDVVNVSGFNLTMDVASNSHVADGTGCVITALTGKRFIWDSAASLWFHS